MAHPRENKYVLYTYALLVFISSQLRLTLSYNIEVEKVGISRGEKNSQYGYTVAIIPKPGWNDLSTFYKKELLVGAPNITYNNIKSHGQVFRCTIPTDKNITCEKLHLTDDSNLCAKVSKNTDSECTTDSRLGATMEVNRKFPDIKWDTTIPKMPMVTICAPGWRNVFPETMAGKYQNYMTGMCLKVRDDLRTLSCADRSYCWPFWPTKDTTNEFGRPVFTYAEGGMSAAFTRDGRSEVIAAPGADDWRGAFKIIQKNVLYRMNRETTTNTLYFGYAIVTGKFGSAQELIVSGSPNWNEPDYTGHFGKCPNQHSSDLRSYIDSIDARQTGSKFGAALAAVDLTGDEYDELLVGAPLYTGDNPEEGRVFVYSSSEDGICGPIGILSGGANVASLKDKVSFARFGSAISSAGDLDHDSFNDVAIGAPYEDDGTGAIYIYPGVGQCGCKMEDKFSQRIAGSDLDVGIRTFGWSIYGNEDIDDNSFPDLAVGAYESNTAFMLRARPIVDVHIEMKMTPNPIPLNGSLIDCSTDSETLCFNVQVLFQFNAVGTRNGNVSEVKLRWTLDSDTVHKSKEGWSRVKFRGPDGTGTWTENITLSSSMNRNNLRKYVIDVKGYRGKPEPKDAWTQVRMEGRFELIPTKQDSFTDLDPILKHDAKTHIVENIEFDKKCDSITTCTSDLKLTVEMFLTKEGVVPTQVKEDTNIYIDAANILQVTADTTNLFNSSYRANVSGEVSALMKRDASPNNGLVGASCKYESPHQTSTTIYCTADSKLDRNENMKIKMYFDVSRQRLIPGMDMNKMKEYVHIDLVTDQTNKDVNMDNNMFERKIPVKLKFQVIIQADKETSDQIRYKADEKSTRKITLIHRYFLINEGPSFLPKTVVNISIPLSKDEVDFAIIKDTPSKCSVRGHAPIVQTTTPASTTKSTTKFPIPPETEVERRRREAEQEPKTAKSSADKPQETAKNKNITCEDYTCAIIECEVLNLEHNKQETIDITVDVYEKELAKEKEVREIRYKTVATVTDPFIWYGGKVVPWDKTVYAEKWTTFVVEPTSVVSEVNIWIIIGSVLGALALLIIVIVILWRCGFFARKKHSQVQKWKRASLYNRKSVRTSSHEKQPYTSMEEKELNQ
ncbi:integrin alpha-4-like isoform X2 [Mercenaria mercenaria]|uniref:integrin alpha-4-like isoform X2 n=1 Tax=Mercenaria mercenaria TaxID=6596 RepID=UPI00234E9393|nr:integrin alpha-4-like isoform X2 [Mercenaria mercenaria]